jgi:outer membrane lipoprotein LolB
MMRRRLLIALMTALLSACVTTRAPRSGLPWQQRLADLQQLTAWQVEGRAAVAIGTQGWQASMTWRQRDSAAGVHLSGPFGIGALQIKQTPSGLSLNGAPPSDAVTAQLQDRLGFDLPLDSLRFWLLGVPEPQNPFELERNEEDRARQLTQNGWRIQYDRYMAVQADMLPALLVLSRDSVRVRIVVDHWELP